jgi:hypothetical protein
MFHQSVIQYLQTESMECGNYRRKSEIIETHPLKNRTRLSDFKIILLERLVKKTACTRN